jgi:hypothetical protein
MTGPDNADVTRQAALTIGDHALCGEDGRWNDVCSCGWESDGDSDIWSEHLTHVLAAAGLLADPVETGRLRAEEARVKTVLGPLFDTDDYTHSAGQLAETAAEVLAVDDVPAKAMYRLITERDLALWLHAETAYELAQAEAEPLKVECPDLLCPNSFIGPEAPAQLLQHWNQWHGSPGIAPLAAELDTGEAP